VYNLAPQFMYIDSAFTHVGSAFAGKINKVIEYVYMINGGEFKIPREEVTHIKYANPTRYGVDTLYGLSPLVAGFLTLTGLTNNQTAHASILENQGAAGILSNESDYALDPEQRDIQQDLFDKKYTGATKFGKIIQSMAKVKYTRLGLDPTSLKIIEGKSLKMRDLCNIYDVSSVLFNDPQNRIQANLTPAETAFWINAVIPNVNLVIKGFDDAVVEKYNLLEFGNSNKEYYIELDTSSIPALQKDAKAEAEKNKVRVSSVGEVLGFNISSQSKVAILVRELGYTEDEAKEISQATQTT